MEMDNNNGVIELDNHTIYQIPETGLKFGLIHPPPVYDQIGSYGYIQFHMVPANEAQVNIWISNIPPGGEFSVTTDDREETLMIKRNDPFFSDRRDHTHIINPNRDDNDSSTHDGWAASQLRCLRVKKDIIPVYKFIVD